MRFARNLSRFSVLLLHVSVLLLIARPAVAQSEHTFTFDPSGGHSLSPGAELFFDGVWNGRMKVRPDWLNTDWFRRIKIVVDNPGTAQPEFPIAVTLGKEVEDAFWLHLQTVGAEELRMTQADGTTEIPFWVEEFHPPFSGSIGCPRISQTLISSGDLPPSFDFDGQSLSFVFKETQHSINFAGNGLSLDDVVTQINDSSTPLKASKFGNRLRLHIPRGPQQYDYFFHLQSTPPLTQLLLANGQYWSDFLVSPSGVSAPCLLLWFRASLPVGKSTYWLYYDNPDPLVVNKSNPAEVFSTAALRPTHVVMTDRQGSSDLFLGSLMPANTIRVDDGVNWLDLGLDDGLTAVIPDSFVNVGSKILSTGPVGGFFSLSNTDVLQPLSTLGHEFFFVIPRGTTKLYFYAPEGPVDVVVEEWRFDSGPKDSVMVKDQVVALSDQQFSNLAFDMGDDHIVRIRTLCPVAMPGCVVPRILVSQRDTSGNVDAFPLLPPATDLWGIRTGNTLIAAMQGNGPASNGIGTTTKIREYVYDNSPLDYELYIGEVRDDAGGVIGLKGQGDPVHLQVTENGRRISGIQWRDGDGTDATPFLRYFDLGRAYNITVPVEYIAMATTRHMTSCTVRFGQCPIGDECPAGSSCVNQRCEVVKVASGTTDYPWAGKLHFGETRRKLSCSIDSECDGGQTCIGGTMCGCTTAANCFDGQACVNNRCVFPITDTGTKTVSTSTGSQVLVIKDSIDLKCNDRVYVIVDDGTGAGERLVISPKFNRPTVSKDWPIATVEPEVDFPYLVNLPETITTPFVAPAGSVLQWNDVTGNFFEFFGDAELRYQIGVGGSWFYYNIGTGGWEIALNHGDSNPIDEVGANIGAGWPSGTPQDIRVRVILTSIGGQLTPQIHNLTLSYTSGVPPTDGDDGIEPPDLEEDLPDAPDLDAELEIGPPLDNETPDLEDDGFIDPDMIGPPLPASFQIELIPNQTVGAQFNVTITALDTFNNRLFGYDGFAQLTEIASTPIGVSDIQFTDGQAIVPITINVPLPMAQLVVTQGLVVVASNQFQVNANLQLQVVAPQNVLPGKKVDLKVTVTDETATGVPGQFIQLAESLLPVPLDSNAPSDATGEITTTFDAPVVPGMYSYTVFLTSDPGVFKTFVVKVLALKIVKVANGAGTQPVPLNMELSIPFTVRVEDENGVAVPDWPVTYEVVTGDATIDGFSDKILTDTTNSSGLIGFNVITGSTNEQLGLVASLDNGEFVDWFLFMGTPTGNSMSVTIDVKEAPINSYLPGPFKVTVLDSTNQPLVNTPIEFQLFDNLNTLSTNAVFEPSPSINTDGNGQVQVNMRWLAVQGTYKVVVLAPTLGLTKEITDVKALPGSGVSSTQSSITAVPAVLLVDGSVTQVSVVVRDDQGFVLVGGYTVMMVTDPNDAGSPRTTLTYNGNGTYTGTWGCDRVENQVKLNATVDGMPLATPFIIDCLPGAIDVEDPPDIGQPDFDLPDLQPDLGGPDLGGPDLGGPDLGGPDLTPDVGIPDVIPDAGVPDVAPDLGLPDVAPDLGQPDLSGDDGNLPPDLGGDDGVQPQPDTSDTTQPTPDTTQPTPDTTQPNDTGSTEEALIGFTFVGGGGCAVNAADPPAIPLWLLVLMFLGFVVRRRRPAAD